MNIEEMDFTVRTYNALKRFGIDTAEDCIARLSEIEKRTQIAHLEVKEKLKELGLMPETKVIVSEDYTRAVTLDKRIKANSHAMEDCFWEVCKGLKEMRDGKLYKELGYQNFEDYSQNEIGFSREQARKYIKISETYSDENANPGWHLGATKLFLLTKLDEPIREEFIQNNDVSEMSKRELEEKIKEINDLKAENEKMQEYTKQLADRNRNLQEKYSEKEDIIVQLEDRIEELENSPVTVAVADNSHEIENMRKAMDTCDKQWADKYSAKEDENLELSREITRYKRKIEELENNAEPAVSEEDGKEVFKAYLANAIDAINRLIGCLKKYPGYREKAEELMNTTMKKMEEI